MLTSKKSFTYFSWVLFLFLFIYINLRAYYVDPLHDEIASYINFIESGEIFSKNMILDANNHLLNSFICRFIYRITDSGFYFYRLPNILAFVLYYVASVSIVNHIKSQAQVYKITLLIALNCVAFVLEYFAMCRGYGLGLAFFLWAIMYLIKWNKENTLKNFFLVLTFSYLSMLSNLVFINSIFIIVSLLIFQLFLNFQYINKKTRLLSCLGFLLFIISSIPIIYFGLLLKVNGALYYGDLTGFWEITVKSLSKHVLDYDENWIKWVYLVLCIFIGFKLIQTQWENWKKFRFLGIESIVFILFFGNIFLTFFLAKILHVNYPEDRAAIYFVPLFILLVFLALQELKIKAVSFLLLLLSLPLFGNLNLSTSIVTPDQRLSSNLYNKIRPLLKDNTIKIYPTAALCWAMFERQKENKIIASSSRSIQKNFDVYITKKEFIKPEIDLSKYKLIAQDLNADFYIFKRENNIKAIEIKRKSIDTYWGKDEFVEFFNDTLNLNFKTNVLRADLNLDLEIDSVYNNISIVFVIENMKNETLFYEQFPLRWYYGAKNIFMKPKISEIFPNFNSKENIIKVYLWNQYNRVIKINSGNLQLSTSN